jgi:hypothetical protein
MSCGSILTEIIQSERHLPKGRLYASIVKPIKPVNLNTISSEVEKENSRLFSVQAQLDQRYKVLLCRINVINACSSLFFYLYTACKVMFKPLLPFNGSLNTSICR